MIVKANFAHEANIELLESLTMESLTINEKRPEVGLRFFSLGSCNATKSKVYVT